MSKHYEAHLEEQFERVCKESDERSKIYAVELEAQKKEISDQKIIIQSLIQMLKKKGVDVVMTDIHGMAFMHFTG